MNVISFADALSEIKQNNPDLWNQLKGDKGDQGVTGAPGLKAEINADDLKEAVDNSLSQESTVNAIKDKLNYDGTISDINKNISNINSTLDTKVNNSDLQNKINDVNNDISDINNKFKDADYLAYINNNLFNTNTCYLNFNSLFPNLGLEVVKEIGNNTYIVCENNGFPKTVNMSTTATRDKWQALFGYTLSYISYNQQNIYNKQIICSLPNIYKTIENPLLSTISPGTYACASEVNEIPAEEFKTIPPTIKLFEFSPVGGKAEICKLDYISYNTWCQGTSKSYINSMIAYCRTNNNDIIWFNFLPQTKSLYNFKYYIGVIKNNDKLRYLTI